MMPTFHVGSPSSQLRSLAKVAVIPLHDFKHRSGGRWTAGCQQSKNRVAVELLKTQIPAGYIIGGQSLSAGVEVGKLDIFFDVDHP